MSLASYSKKTTKGFTIVELLIVIVIIAILAAISFVAYNGLTNRAKRAAMEAEADKLTKQLAIYRADNSAYPTTIETDDCADSDELEELALCFESDYYIDYGLFNQEDDDPTNDDYWFEIWPFDENGDICKEEGCGGGLLFNNEDDNHDTISGLPEAGCPKGFIPVPGSAFYSQPGFCVMKYEASNLNGKAVSRYDLPSWGSVTHNQAVDYAQTACDGCQLMTPSQWMTLARDIIQVDKNWTGNKAFEGDLYLGFTTLEYTAGLSVPPLLKSSNDEDGYFGVNREPDQEITTVNDTGEAITIRFVDHRRTFYLSNGEVIWDLAGHFAEQIDLIVETGKPQCHHSNIKTCAWYDVAPDSLNYRLSPLTTGLLKQNNILNKDATIGVLVTSSDNLPRSVAVGAMPFTGGGGLFGSWFILKPDQVFLNTEDPVLATSPYLASIITELNGEAPIGFRATLE